MDEQGKEALARLLAKSGDLNLWVLMPESVSGHRDGVLMGPIWPYIDENDFLDVLLLRDRGMTVLVDF